MDDTARHLHVIDGREFILTRTQQVNQLPLGDKGTEYMGIPSTLSNVYSGGGRSVFLQLALYL